MATAKNEVYIGLYHESYYLVGGNEPLVGGIKIWWREFPKFKFLASGGGTP